MKGVSWLEEFTDEWLIQRSIQGDQQAFSLLCQRYESSVTRFIRYQVNDTVAREDIFQETLLTSWRNLNTLNKPDKFKSWILQIARNKCKDYYRRQNHVDQPMEDEVLEYRINRHGVTHQKKSSLIERVLEEMEEISPAEKQLLRYFYFQGMTVAEVAVKNGVPIGTIKSRLHTARQHIRRKLDLNNERSPEDEQ
ncbi:sigma-70 family RNA polymerase sigma factor [Lederbergia sp. NSJ-179]|uniref:RNA polymerase sigma factor n=1 Tax=Lederbergia sp. NSJ-179 TaxID=2931402 RepID=UPI001FD08416|nr:sigma-70 family RNA polymerase sigma factor [Lederbergia sp. NSJ-179]MCJ7842406.1 sigma-70 family RNA polymerase sigma factor [Lederbergia sp. NSJ-179]